MSPAAEPIGRLVLLRHGETEWSRDGRHTGRTDVPLTTVGERDARQLAPRLAGFDLRLVLCSPLSRARRTAELAGLDPVTDDDLMEWDYGAYEGRTTPEIREERPGWLLWNDGVPGGEAIAEVGGRADRVIAELREADGDALLFAHGHVLRVLTARWLGLEPDAGRLFALDPATLSTLGYEHETAVLRLWNRPALI